MRVALMSVTLIRRSLQEQGVLGKIPINIELPTFSHLLWGEFPPQAWIRAPGAALGPHGAPAPLWERGLSSAFPTGAVPAQGAGNVPGRNG